jgi:hypothetical protein
MSHSRRNIAQRQKQATVTYNGIVVPVVGGGKHSAPKEGVSTTVVGKVLTQFNANGASVYLTKTTITKETRLLTNYSGCTRGENPRSIAQAALDNGSDSLDLFMSGLKTSIDTSAFSRPPEKAWSVQAIESSTQDRPPVSGRRRQPETAGDQESKTDVNSGDLWEFL